MDTEATRNLVTTYLDALGSGDRDTVRACLADDVVWEVPATSPNGGATGAEEVGKALGSKVVKENFDVSQPFEVQRHSLIVDGDKAVVQQRIGATARATGKPYDNEYCWVYTCADGKIVHMYEYVDTLYAARTFGWPLEG